MFLETLHSLACLIRVEFRTPVFKHGVLDRDHPATDGDFIFCIRVSIQGHPPSNETPLDNGPVPKLDNVGWECLPLSHPYGRSMLFSLVP